jgi:hypothetical protein
MDIRVPDKVIDKLREVTGAPDIEKWIVDFLKGLAVQRDLAGSLAALTEANEEKAHKDLDAAIETRKKELIDSLS